MGMTIDEHIGVIEDLEYTMKALMPEPEKTEICTSLKVAIETMHKYQKIVQIMERTVDDGTSMYDTLQEIEEVIEDGQTSN